MKSTELEGRSVSCERGSGGASRIEADIQRMLDRVGLSGMQGVRFVGLVREIITLEIRAYIEEGVGIAGSPQGPLVERACLPNRARLRGGYWIIEYRGETLPAIKDSQGMRLHFYLMDKPHRKMHVLDLLGLTRHGNPAPDHLRGSASCGEVLNTQALKALIDRLRELRQEIEAAKLRCDMAQEQRLGQELAILKKELYAKARPERRRFVDSSEKARSSVRHAIRRAQKQMGKASPDLEKYLSQAIRTGIHCEFSPLQEDTGWEIALTA